MIDRPHLHDSDTVQVAGLVGRMVRLARWIVIVEFALAILRGAAIGATGAAIGVLLLSGAASQSIWAWAIGWVVVVLVVTEARVRLRARLLSVTADVDRLVRERCCHDDHAELRSPR